jgi:ATP synthase protein I
MGISSSDKPAKQKQRGSVLRTLLFASQIGVSIVVCLFIGVFLGKFLDERLGTSPWLLLTFALLGAASAFWMLIKLGTKK